MLRADRMTASAAPAGSRPSVHTAEIAASHS